MRWLLSKLAIFMCLVGAGCSDKPKIEADLGVKVANPRWQLKVEALSPGGTVRVTLKNVSNKPLRAYEIAEFASIHLLSAPELPLPIVQPVTVPFSNVVKAGDSLEQNISIGRWVEAENAKPGEYVCRIKYTDELPNGRLDPLQKSEVGELTSNDFGFTIANGKVIDLWYRDGDTIMMPQENGLAMWPAS